MLGRLMVLVAMLALGTAESPETWYECATLLPKGMTDQQQEFTPSPFAVWTRGSFVARGEALTVSLKCLHTEGAIESFTSFVVQAHYLGQMAPGHPGGAIGTWEVQDGLGQGQHCINGGDGFNTLSSSDITEKCNIVATWRAPDDLQGPVEFLATFQDKDGKFWLKVNSIQVDLSVQEEDALAKDTATPVPSMSDDMHGTLKEVELAAQYAEKQYQEIQDEDKNSEGDWQRKQEEDRRKHEEEMRWEMEQYEKMRAEQERARMERIRMEMLDKEEYDRQMWEAEHPVNTTPEVIEENPAKDDNVISIDDTDDDIDGNLIGKSVAATSGATTVTSGLLSLLLLALYLH